MSTKIRTIFICSILMLHYSMIEAEIDCEGYNFYCSTYNSYLPCSYDEVRKITVTVTDRSITCPVGTFCDTQNEKPCDTGIDCAGKDFFCPTVTSYKRCDLKPDGSFRTSSNDVTACPDAFYCDNINGGSECDSLVVPDPESSTTESTTVTTEATTEVPTTVSTAAPGLGELPGYTCPSAGRFPHPTDCRRYIFCVRDGLTYRNSQRQCPNELVYHPDFDGCKLDATPCDNMDFKCVTTGRFADALNPSKYIWCLKVNGNFQALKYSCPIGKIYDGNSACVEPIIINEIETLALDADDSLNVYSTSRRSLSVQIIDEAGGELYEESDEMVADRISLNSNEDASVYSRRGKYGSL